MAIHYLNVPLKDKDVESLSIGDLVYVSGPFFTCRSLLHHYVFDQVHDLPFSTKNRNCLIHVGPIVVKENEGWRLVSFMPTSSIRFEKWGARSVEEWGLKMIVGKTTMGEKTMQKMVEKKCVHVSPQSVSPNLWIDHIKITGVHLFDELGTIEAAWQMEADKLGPFVVDIDTKGRNLFDKLDVTIAENKEKAYEMLNIPKDFEYTKLY